MPYYMYMPHYMSVPDHMPNCMPCDTLLCYG